MSNNTSVLDMDYLARYIAKKSGIAIGIVREILDGELEFLTGEGIAVDEQPTEQDDIGYLDFGELIDFVTAKTGLERVLVKKVLEAEEEYLVDIGISIPL